MRRLWRVIVLLASFPQQAPAQERGGWGYLFAGAGRSSGDVSRFVLQGGAGGEFLLRSGIGLAGELNYTAPASGRIGGFGAAAINASCHFDGRNPTRKLVPFLTGGGFLTFSGTNAGANLGGGVQYWWNDGTAVRLEFRTHILSSDAPYVHVFRFGVAFR